MPAADPQARALAWALRDACYESWNSDPSRATRAAQALQSLVAAGVPPEQAREVQALADWAAGLAAIIRAQMNEAIQYLDAAATALRSIGLADAAAQTQVPKIMALSMLGQHEAAAACAMAAQRELVALGNLRGAAKVSQNLGSMCLRRDGYAEAARHYREAAVLFARVGDRAYSVLADVGLADTLTAMGDFDEALRIYERARMRATAHRLEPQLALVDESIALVDLARGRYREALAGLESARRRYEALSLPQYVAVAEKQLGDAYLDLHLLPEALALFKNAAAKFAALEMPGEQAWALTQQGRTETLLGGRDADSALAEGARLFEAEGNAVGAASVALVRAERALASGAAADASHWADAAAAAFADANHAIGSARADVLRAQAMLATGRIEAAAAMFQATLQRARAQQQTTLQVRCLSGLGQVAQARGDAGAARDAFERAIALFEQQRRALPDDDMRAAFLTDHLRPYLERLRLALDTGRPEDILVQLERFRARALDERMADDTTGPEPDAWHRTARERVRWLVRHLQTQEQEASTSGALADELQRLEHELLERGRRARLLASSTDAIATGTSGAQDAVEPAPLLDTKALRGALSQGDALVEYGVLDDELLACVVTRGGVVVHRRLAAWTDVVEVVRAARFQVETMRHGAGRLQQHMDTLAARMQARMARLHDLLWRPLADQLIDIRRVLVVPHGPLADLPFAALFDGEGVLGERFEFALAPSSRAALRGLARTPTAIRHALVLADSERLPHAAGEAEFVARQFAQARLFTGSEATLAHLQAEAADADVLHLACHAQFRSDNPRFSALHLHDGPLAVDAAEALSLGPCIVTLSACETGLADMGAGDERVGLVRAFLVAGAARVMASLWAVDDRLTERFMIDFYGALTAGHAPASALRQAQAALRRDEPHPYAWAAFTLYGGW